MVSTFLHDVKNKNTVGVTGRQRMPTPPRHQNPPLSLENCSAFEFVFCFEMVVCLLLSFLIIYQKKITELYCMLIMKRCNYFFPLNLWYTGNILRYRLCRIIYTTNEDSSCPGEVHVTFYIRQIE